MSDTFWSVLRARAVLTPDRPAIVHDSRTTTCADWVAHAERYAAAFLALGGSAGDRALVWMTTSPDMAAAMLGTWRCGGIFALLDPRARAEHFLHAIRTVSPKCVFADDRATLPADPGIPVLVPGELGNGRPPLPDAACPLPVDPASIVFTSGSTGRPKGVTQSHGSLVRACRTVTGYLGVEPDDRILCTVPMSFDYGFGQVLSAILTGATLVLPSEPSPVGMCAAIERHRPTVLAGVPSVFTYLLRGVSPFRTTDLSSIRIITNTGGTIPSPILHELLELLPGRRLFLNYGLTETYRTSYLDPSLVETNPQSIGRAIPGAGVVIVRDDGSPAPPGEVGEIVHRGDYICLGYWNDPEATARALRPDPLAVPGCPRAPLAVFTGDLGRTDENGLLYYCGRRDRQLKPMGVRINPSETEDALHRSGLVREVAVLGRKHDLLGDELWALVVPVDGSLDPAALVQQLRDYGRRVLSAYMMPQRFVVRDELPKTTSGKIDYPRLTRDIGERA